MSRVYRAEEGRVDQLAAVRETDDQHVVHRLFRA
jgi:hypothetical protein